MRQKNRILTIHPNRTRMGHLIFLCDESMTFDGCRSLPTAEPLASAKLRLRQNRPRHKTQGCVPLRFEWFFAQSRQHIFCGQKHTAAMDSALQPQSEYYADPIPKSSEKGNAPNLAHDTRLPETKSVSYIPGCTELDTKMSRDNSFA